ncbi:MAG: alpha/beta hydrolase [Actinomycetes bacterium]
MSSDRAVGDRAVGGRAEVSRAVVIVSGGASISPFTTPSEAARTGFAAGSTDTALREHLLTAGYRVFTSPAALGAGPAERDEGFAGFDNVPLLLPAALTVNAAGSIQDAGASLAAFLTHLAREYDVATVDLVGHSMGGLFSRAALPVLRENGSPVQIASLTTIGTPWEGAFSADFALGDLAFEAALDSIPTQTSMREFALLAEVSSEGASQEVTRRYLAGEAGWNERQRGVLDDLPVVLIAGDYFSDDDGQPEIWPHDGLVSRHSALALGVSPEVLPPHGAHTFPDVHSIYFTDRLGLPMERALTWDPDVLATVVGALEMARR